MSKPYHYLKATISYMVLSVSRVATVATLTPIPTQPSYSHGDPEQQGYHGLRHAITAWKASVDGAMRVNSV